MQILSFGTGESAMHNPALIMSDAGFGMTAMKTQTICRRGPNLSPLF